MKPKVYIETSVISYLTSRRSRDLLIAAHQEITLQWWEKHETEFACCISALVEDEIAQGDGVAAAQRIATVRDIPVLRVTEEAIVLSRQLVASGLVPKSATADALHIAIAAVNNTNILLTWNCKHLANAILRRRIRVFVESAGYVCPEICTPDELLEF